MLRRLARTKKYCITFADCVSNLPLLARYHVPLSRVIIAIIIIIIIIPIIITMYRSALSAVRVKTETPRDSDTVNSPSLQMPSPNGQDWNV